MKRIVFILAIISLFLSSPAFTHGGESHSDTSKKHEVTPVETIAVKDALAVLENGHAALQEDVAVGKLDNVHGTVEDMASALRLIASTRKNDETVVATAQQLEKIWRALHGAADTNDLSRAQAELNKVSDGLKILLVRMQPVEK